MFSCTFECSKSIAVSCDECLWQGTGVPGSELTYNFEHNVMYSSYFHPPFMTKEHFEKQITARSFNFLNGFSWVEAQKSAVAIPVLPALSISVFRHHQHNHFHHQCHHFHHQRHHFHHQRHHFHHQRHHIISVINFTISFMIFIICIIIFIISFIILIISVIIFIICIIVFIVAIIRRIHNIISWGHHCNSNQNNQEHNNKQHHLISVPWSVSRTREKFP